MSDEINLLHVIPDSVPKPPYFEPLPYGEPEDYFPVLGKLIQESAEKNASDTAIIDEKDNFYSFSDIHKKARSLCMGIIQSGFEIGQKIVVLLPNCVEWIISFLSAVTIGTVIPADDWVPIDTTKYVIQQSDADYVVCVKSKMEDLIKAGVTNVKYITIDHKAENVLFMPEMLSASYDNATEQKLEDIINSLKNTDVVFILYTSGTVTMPKGAMLTHANIAHNATETGWALEASKENNDRVHCAPPFSHCFGNVFGISMAWLHGIPLYIVKKYDPKKSVEQISKHNLTLTYGTPTQFRKMLPYFNDPEIYKNRCLRSGIMAGEPCPPELIEQMMELGCDIRVIYGLTESSPGTNVTRSSDPIEKKSTAGRAFRGCVVRIEDPKTGDPLDYGKDGEVVIYGPGIMLGYYKCDDQTKAITSKWGGLKTGDMGRMDSDGYLEITGRIKNVVIRGGNNLYPIVIESRMMRFLSDILESIAIVGVKDKIYGEEIGAVLKTKEGVNLTKQEFVDMCYEQSVSENPLLSHEEVPRYVWINDLEIPVSGRNKVLNLQLKNTVERIVEVEKLKKIKPTKLK